jgi:RAC serine/threonine-protein kinase
VKAADKVGIQDFDLLQVIGKGSFGKVFQVRKKDTKKIYALKVLQKKAIIERKELEHTRTEKNVLTKLVHPFLVNMYWCFQTEDKVCFVMDFVNGGELFSHLQANRRLPEDRVRFYSAEIVLGLEYLHNNGILYRDLKPENVLLSEDGHAILTDFGIAKEGLIAANDRTATFCGTPEYLAPEVLKGERYGKAIDWWSFGTIIFEMLRGSPPFYNSSVQAMYRAILEKDPPYPDDCSPQALAIMRACIERDPVKRLQDPKQIKAHPFFAGIDWEKLAAKELVPPYIPPVKSKEDVSMISREFLDLEVALDAEPNHRLSASIQKEFADFGN